LYSDISVLAAVSITVF